MRIRLKHISTHVVSSPARRRLSTLAAFLLAVALHGVLPLHGEERKGTSSGSRSDSAPSAEKEETKDRSGDGSTDAAGEATPVEVIIPVYPRNDASGNILQPPGRDDGALLENSPGGVPGHLPDLSSANPLSVGSHDYIIGPQDLLDVMVLNAESLNRMVRVADDGSITLPLVGEVTATGLSRKELERLLAGKLRKGFVKDAQVTVFVREAVSKRVSIIGAVRNPGSYDLVGRRTLLEVLSQAGGVIPEFGVDRLVILRRTANGTLSIPVDLDALVVLADPAADVELLPGDIINVPVENFIEIYVYGAVRMPTVYKVKSSEPVTLLQVITMAGGVLPGGSERRVQIMRRTADGQTEIIHINLKKVRKGKIPDPRLQKDDVIIIPEARF